MLGVESTSPTLALSREPRAVAAEQYAFYADVDGDLRDERFADALRELREVTSALHIIGSYDATTAPPRPHRAPAVVVDVAPAVVPQQNKPILGAARS